MRLIDRELTCDQFAGLDPQTTMRLVTTVEQDFCNWTARLIEAAEASDAEAVRRARHALAGLCGAFGADALGQASTGPLATGQEKEALLAASHATIAAIRDTAMAERGA